MRELNNIEIKDLLITALEGASNYWYLLDNLKIPPQKSQSIFTQSERIALAVMGDNESFVVYDVNNPELVLGELSLENIKRGNNLMMVNEPRMYLNVISGNFSDIESITKMVADKWLQFVVVGTD